MKGIRILTAPKLNLLLKIENSVELFTKTSEELLRELEKEERARVKLTLRTRPRWFYRDHREPQQVYLQSEISKVEEQLRCEFDGVELEVALEIVANLDHRGFFRGKTEDIAFQYGLEEDFVEDIREFIKREVEPLGVACKNLEEFVLLQLEELYPEKRALHGEVLAVLKGKSKNLQARELLSRLKLSPFEGECAVCNGGRVDVVFEYDGGEWYVFLMDDFFEVESAGRGRSISFILELRRRLLRTACELILERQSGFMLGKEPLKSLTLSEVARKAGANLSTVSRVISGKYAKTPAGIYPLRVFFLRESVRGLSREEILRVLKELLKTEGKDRSDAELSRLLSQRGINIARRTVNKYRKMIEGVLKHRDVLRE